MDFSFTEEQTLLRNSVQKFVQNDYTFDNRRTIAKSDTGWSRKNWSTFAELGLLGAPFAEEHGGLGGGPIETMIIMEEFGRGLVIAAKAPTGRVLIDVIRVGEVGDEVLRDRRHIARCGEDDVRPLWIALPGPRPDGGSSSVVSDGLVHREPLRQRLRPPLR